MDINSMKGRKVLVTGGNGFIGSHVVSRLVENECNVYVMIRASSDTWRLDEVKDSIVLIETDIRDGETLNKWMAQIKPEYLFHLAAYGVDSRLDDYKAAAEINIIGTVNMVKAAAGNGCRRFLNTGTSMQYGNKDKSIKEEDCYRPINIYGSTKGAATIVAHQLAGETDMEIATIIPFGVFGEKEGSHKFFPYVILSALRDEDIRLSPCEQYRDYCYIENIIDGFITAAVKPGISNEIFNIGCGRVYKLKHYVELIMKQLGLGKKVNYGGLEYRKNDLWSPEPDLERITERLGWKPMIALEEGIERTIEWFRENHEKYSVKGR